MVARDRGEFPNPTYNAYKRADGALDRASPSFMGLASLGLAIPVFFDFLHSALLFNAILGLGVLGLALSRPQVRL